MKTELLKQICEQVINLGLQHGKQMIAGENIGVHYPFVLPFSTEDFCIWTTEQEHYTSLMLTANNHDSRRVVVHTYAFGGGTNRVEMPVDVSILELKQILDTLNRLEVQNG